MADEQDPVGSVDAAVARLRSDRVLLAIVRAAREWGVSPSRFTGRPAVVEHQLDQFGRTVRTLADPDWTPDDQALALGLLSYEAGLCPGCRHDLERSTAAEAEDAYTADLRRCHACTAIAVTSREFAENPHPQALHFWAVPRPPRPPADDEQPDPS